MLIRSLLLALASFGSVGVALASPTERAEVRVNVDSPQPGSIVRGRFDMLELSGIAQAGARQSTFDVMLVIDVSASALYPSGLDIDNDGVFGTTKKALVPGMGDTKNTDPDDSILAAELMAAQRMVEALDPKRVRVGVVTFSGEADPVTYRRRSPEQQDAWLEQSLTTDYTLVQRALEAVRIRGASGGTNMEAGVKLALQELAGVAVPPLAQSPGAGEASGASGERKVILLLTDGRPSLPFGRVMDEDPEDIEAVVSAAKIAAEADIKINVFGLGPGAINYPYAVTEVTRATGGLYTPVRRPGDVVALLTGVSFANVEDIVAVNLTIGQMSGPTDVELLPDGSFRGFVPVQPGINRIRVSALASDGTRGSAEFEVNFLQQELSNAELQSELERVRKRNRDIQILQERNRQEAFREAERARALTLEVDETAPSEDSPSPETPGTQPSPSPKPPTPKPK